MYDLVIPMVFPQDPEWQRAYTLAGGYEEKSARFRSWGTEELLLQCCIRFMRWLRCIHILLASESQVQPWMKDPLTPFRKADPLTPFRGNDNVNGNCLTSTSTITKIESLTANRSTLTEIHPSSLIPKPQVKLVFHREFIPAKWLPTFNANTIEMCLHNIPDLSEHFIYSNDDVFPISALRPEDFFRDNVPCQHYSQAPYPNAPTLFQRFVKHGLDMVAADFGVNMKNTWLCGGHSMTPMLRSTVEKVCNRHRLQISCSITFRRDACNYNQYIFPFYQHFSGKYIDYAPARRYIGPAVDTGSIPAILSDPTLKIVCLNDNEKITDLQHRAEVFRRCLI